MNKTSIPKRRFIRIFDAQPEFNFFLRDLAVHFLGYNDKDASTLGIAYSSSGQKTSSCGVWLHRPKTSIDLRDRVLGWEILSPALPRYRGLLQALGYNERWMSNMRIVMDDDHSYLVAPSDRLGISFYARSDNPVEINMLSTVLFGWENPNSRACTEAFVKALVSNNKGVALSTLETKIVCSAHWPERS